MLVYNLQLFGGRGSAADRDVSQLSSNDWASWSEDPSIYQALERGEDLSEFFEEQEMTEWADDYKQMARRLQSEASTHTVEQATLYRGERFNSLEDARKKYAVGNTVTTGQLTSYSTDTELAKSYATMYDNKVAVIIENTNTNGKFVGLRANHYGYASGKDPEVIVARGTESKVTSTRYDSKANILYVRMSSTNKPKKKRGKI